MKSTTSTVTEPVIELGDTPDYRDYDTPAIYRRHGPFYREKIFDQKFPFDDKRQRGYRQGGR